MIGAKDIKRGDSVYIGSHDRWVSVLRVGADRTAHLSNGRQVRESELDYYGANCWRYHPEPASTQCPPGVHSIFDFCPGDCTEPFDPVDDATQLRKASEDALSFALRRAGWTEGQIVSGLRGHRNAYAHELAARIREETATLKRDGVLEPDKFRPCRDAADQIDPEVTR